VDIVMPPGGGIAPESVSYGAATGIENYRRLRLKFGSVPVIVLTNINSREILAGIASDAKAIAVTKFEVTPFAFAEIVEEQLGLKLKQ